MSETDIPKSRIEPDWLRLVQQKVESLNYGVVQLIVHDGRVTQIERTEKTRLKPGGHKSDPN